MQPTDTSDAPIQNWAGNIAYHARHVAHVRSIEELQEVVRRSANVRALGSRHSFNGIADSPDTLVSMERLDRVLEIDAARRSVTIEGGVRYGHLGAHLHREGFALHNLASLPHISVAGACATATHGSGEGNGNLATAVSAIELVTPSGELMRVSRETHGEEFNGMAASLGALGIVARITLDILPTYTVHQHVFENLPLEQAVPHFDDIQRAGYSVSLFTNWMHERFTQVWVKRVCVPGAESQPIADLYGATPANSHRHPIAGVGADHCTPQLGQAGAWHERLPHFRMEFTPSNGEELQSEYFVARNDAAPALRAVMSIGAKLMPQLLVSEVRTIAADKLWLSPCYQQDSVAFHFTWKRNWADVQPLLHLLEESLAPFAPRPHWGKLFVTEPAQIAAMFPRLNDFRSLRSRMDPDGKFLNAFVARLLGENSRASRYP